MTRTRAEDDVSYTWFEVEDEPTSGSTQDRQAGGSEPENGPEQRFSGAHPERRRNCLIQQRNPDGSPGHIALWSPAYRRRSTD